MMATIMLVACIATWALVLLLLRDAAPQLVLALAGNAARGGPHPWRPAPMRPLAARRIAVKACQSRPVSGRVPIRAFNRACDRTATGTLAA